MLINESSHTETEKHVSVDPVSMKPLPLLPTNYKFLTNSLPNSPRIGGVSQPRSHSPLTCASDSHLQRSKSGGEQRSSVPYGGFDLWANLNNTAENKSSKKLGNKAVQNKGVSQTTTNGANMVKEVKKPNEMDFKCGALCLFLPGFGKGKPVRARRVEPQGSRPSQVVSQRISLEKFECGSWRSSAIHSDDDHTSTLYFDLPLELIRTSVSDNALPMNSAFVFNKGGVKGVLKTKGGTEERKSQEGRHVHFSTSSTTTQPTSPITPRLCKARDDFRAFLEAQSV
ncbi:putative chloroplast enhancing stress tolerance protein [Helianthus debilis subsp. tardiflorus]